MNTADVSFIDHINVFPFSFSEVLESEVAKTTLRGQYIFTQDKEGMSVTKLVTRTKFDLTACTVTIDNRGGSARECEDEGYCRENVPLRGQEIPRRLQKEMRTLKQCVERARWQSLRLC